MDEIIEAAARAIENSDGFAAAWRNDDWPYFDDFSAIARAAIAAIMPAIGERMATAAIKGHRISMEHNDFATKEMMVGESVRALASTMAEEVGGTK